MTLEDVYKRTNRTPIVIGAPHNCTVISNIEYQGKGYALEREGNSTSWLSVVQGRTPTTP